MDLGTAPVQLGHHRTVQFADGRFHLLLQPRKLDVLGLIFLFLLVLFALALMNKF
jgi:hypothetical protein